MVIELPLLQYKRGDCSKEKATGFYESNSCGFFLNSCAAVGIIAGGGTLACVAYEDVKKERCTALEEFDKHLKN